MLMDDEDDDDDDDHANAIPRRALRAALQEGAGMDGDR